jgi:hypothetical protein
LVEVEVEEESAAALAALLWAEKVKEKVKEKVYPVVVGCWQRAGGGATSSLVSSVAWLRWPVGGFFMKKKTRTETNKIKTTSCKVEQQHPLRGQGQQAKLICWKTGKDRRRKKEICSMFSMEE